MVELLYEYPKEKSSTFLAALGNGPIPWTVENTDSQTRARACSHKATLPLSELVNQVKCVFFR